jgi:hypothetical protein
MQGTSIGPWSNMAGTQRLWGARCPPGGKMPVYGEPWLDDMVSGGFPGLPASMTAQHSKPFFVRRSAHDQRLGPAHDGFRDPHSLPEFLFRHRFKGPGISRFNGIVSQPGSQLHLIRKINPVPLQERKKLRQVMNEAKRNPPRNQNRLESFFRCLLGLKTEVLKIYFPRATLPCQGQIAPRASEPLLSPPKFAHVTRHRGPCLLPKRVS